jgi:hypothetical protein
MVFYEIRPEIVVSYEFSVKFVMTIQWIFAVYRILYTNACVPYNESSDYFSHARDSHAVTHRITN